MRSASTLFVLHVGSNAGYAITSCERAFYRAALELAGGDSDRLHFSYRDLARGAPEFLPPGSRARFLAHDPRDRSPANLARLEDYVREQAIDLVVPFDLDALDPLHAAARRGGARAVVGYWGAPLSGPMPGWKLALKRLEVALAPSRADGLIFESEAMARTATHGRGFPGGRVVVNPLGVDVARYRPGKTGLAHAAAGLPPGRKLVVYAGHMEPRKGVGVLVEAALELLARRRRDDVAFLLCGNRPGEAAPFEAAVRAHGLERWVRFGGYRPDLDRLFPDCDVGVIPSVGWDSFTYSAAELAACGLPVLASRLQGLAEAVVDGRTGFLFPPGDSLALADRIAQLLDDPALAARLGRAGRERAERELSLEAQQARFVRAFRRFLAEAPEAAPGPGLAGRVGDALAGLLPGGAR